MKPRVCSDTLQPHFVCYARVVCMHLCCHYVDRHILYIYSGCTSEHAHARAHTHAHKCMHDVGVTHAF